MAKITLRYINGEVPENLADILSNADEQDMRILIALMMAADGNGEGAHLSAAARRSGVEELFSTTCGQPLWRPFR